MAITPATIYINVNVESDTKADKGDITSTSFYGGDSVTSYDIDTSKINV